jgi:hypothetical protein
MGSSPTRHRLVPGRGTSPLHKAAGLVTPGRLATAGAAYLAVLLAIDHFASFHEQLLWAS